MSQTPKLPRAPQPGPVKGQGVEAVLGDGDQRRKKLLQQVQGAGRKALQGSEECVYKV